MSVCKCTWNENVHKSLSLVLIKPHTDTGSDKIFCKRVKILEKELLILIFLLVESRERI